jgi:hypothetical protein
MSTHTRARPSELKPCPRCGVRRRVHSSRPLLCRDCKDVLSTQEVTYWIGAPA